MREKLGLYIEVCKIIPEGRYFLTSSLYGNESYSKFSESVQVLMSCQL